jgi:hypothetical protein
MARERRLRRAGLPGTLGSRLHVHRRRRRLCPLVDPVGLVIVDLWLAGDAALQGTAAVDILGYYLSAGKPVIGICHGSEPVGLFLEDQLVTMDGHPDRRDLLETVRSLSSA